MDQVPNFSSYQEEAAYWKEMAEKCMRQRDEAREELNEFLTSSKELEAELETQLQQSEKKVAEFKTCCNRLKLELDAEREKNLTIVHDRDRDFENIHKELCQIKHMNSGLMRHVQDLEQKNDDLERAKRCLDVSLKDFEDKLNQEMERNAILEVELGEKERVSEVAQRLKDEVRDLRSELRVKSTKGVEVGKGPSSPMSPQSSKSFAPTGGCPVCGAGAYPQTGMNPGTEKSPVKSEHLNGKVNEVETQTGPASPLKGPVTNGSTNGLLTQSARISALNIVGDLLRKVGALESKLASCRNYPNDSSGNSKIPSKMDAQRFGKRIPRGTSSPNVQSLVRAGSTAS